MDKKWILIIFLLLVSSINALDPETYNPCGGDSELVIGCVGDSELFFMGNIPSEITTGVNEEEDNGIRYVTTVEIERLYGTKTTDKVGNLEYYVLESNYSQLSGEGEIVLEQGDKIELTFEALPKTFTPHSAILKTNGYYLPYTKEFYLDQFNYQLDMIGLDESGKAKEFSYSYVNKEEAQIKEEGKFSIYSSVCIGTKTKQECDDKVLESAQKYLVSRIQNSFKVYEESLDGFK